MEIFWFRRDLRIEDNTALYEALAFGKKVLPVFIFDTNILEGLPEDDARVTFIHTLLENVQVQLKKHKRSLAVFHGKPGKVFKKLIEEHDIQAVYANRDYEPYARKRDKAVYELLKDKEIEFKSYKDQVIFEKNEVVKDDGSAYSVYTPYMKKWKAEIKKLDVRQHHPESLLENIATHPYPFLSLKDIGFKASEMKPEPFDISPSIINNYEERRNYPAIDGTSKLSPYLRFGAVSIREVIKKAVAAKNETFLNELIWREFFMQILWHYPETVTKSFRPKYDNIKWRNNEKEFKAWCEGKTGYPMVDAGMRELNSTGYMHNRVRLVVSSFLCKHLLIDWRWGEAYFAEKLFDYEQSSNVVTGNGRPAAAPMLPLISGYSIRKSRLKNLIRV